MKNLLANFYERDIRKFIKEIELFANEEDLWKTAGDINNSCGNLALHIIGGMNYLVGNVLGNSEYIRNRDLEFTAKNIGREELIKQLEALIATIGQTLDSLNDADLEAGYPIFFDEPGTSTQYVLVQLLAHLNYHLGQVNYLRRALS